MNLESLRFCLLTHHYVWASKSQWQISPYIKYFLSQLTKYTVIKESHPSVHHVRRPKLLQLFCDFLRYTHLPLWLISIFHELDYCVIIIPRNFFILSAPASKSASSDFPLDPAALHTIYSLCSLLFCGLDKALEDSSSLSQCIAQYVTPWRQFIHTKQMRQPRVGG